MNHNVEIHISNRQKNFTEGKDQPVEETLESVVSGQLHRKEDKIYLRYEEKLEESEAPVKSCLKFYDGCLQLTRSGSVKVTMLFEEGREHKTGYITPFGTLALNVRTKQLRFTENGENLQAFVEYELDLEDALFAICDMTIHVQKGEDE